MGQVWTFDGTPTTTMGAPNGQVTLLDGTTFCICEVSGDLRQGGAQGLFVRDTRLVSRLELSINGHVPEPLAPQAHEPYTRTFLSRMPPLPGLADSTMLVARKRLLHDGMSDEITLRNMSAEPMPVTLRVGIGGDFADVFEVKEGRVQARPAGEGITVAVTGDAILLSREVGSSVRGARISGARQPDCELEVSASQLTWHAVVPAHGAWSTTLRITPSLNGKELVEYRAPAAGPAERLADWRRQTPLVLASDQRLATVFAASTEDLGSLRIFDPEHADRMVIAAGAPWFMTIFGRDSLLTSWMVAAARPVAGARHDADAGQPAGHEGRPRRPRKSLARSCTRCGSACRHRCALGGSSVYYGTVDATPLFVMLLGELRRWGLDREIVDELLPHADRALDWIVNYGDRDGDGFVEYGRSTELGLANQGWKDSFDGDHLRRRHDGRAADRAGRGAGVRRTRRSSRSRTSAPSGEDTAGAEYWTQRAAGPEGPLQRGVLDAGAGLLRPRPGRRQAADRLARLEHGPLPVDRHRRRGQGASGREAR